MLLEVRARVVAEPAVAAVSVVPVSIADSADISLGTFESVHTSIVVVIQRTSADQETMLLDLSGDRGRMLIQRRSDAVDRKILVQTAFDGDAG